MRVVWKYVLDPVPQPQNRPMPAGAMILHVDVQDDRAGPCVWAEVNPDRSLEDRWFTIVATGEAVPTGAQWVGTFLVDDGDYVFHLYEERGDG